MRASTLAGMAWRESRFARRRLFLFLSAITLGVAALVAVRGFAANLRSGVRDQAKALLGGDIELSSRAPFGAGTRAVLDSIEGAGASVATVTSFNSMVLAPNTGATRLVQVRAPEPGFPFYGSIETEPAGLWPVFSRGRNAIVDPALLVGLGIQPGDSIAVGALRFNVLGALDKVPGDIEIASAFAPRVYIPARFVDATGLVQFGSRVDYAAYLRLPDPGVADDLLDAHRSVFRSEQVRTRTSEQQQERLDRALGRLSSYLGLVGIFALLLGGIGVASAMGAYISRKVDTVAVLRCLGATAAEVTGIYLLQAAVMGLAGAIVGVVLGASVQWVIPNLLTGMLPVDLDVQVDGTAVALGVLVGVSTAVVFALVPLLAIRRVSPLGALRRRVEPLQPPGRDYVRWLVRGLLAVGVYLLLAFELKSFRVGLAMSIGIGATLALLWGAAWVLVQMVRRLPRGALTYTARQGLANLYRPGNQTRSVVIALGFGVFLLGTLDLVQHNLLRPLTPEGVAHRANVVLIDVQDDQLDRVDALLGRHGAPLLQSAAIIPMRITGVNGEQVRPPGAARDTLDRPENDSAADEGRGERRNGGPRGWAVRREYRSTFRDTLVDSEELVAGKWWDSTAVHQSGRPFPVSMEADIADELGVGIGDRIDWDVQGVTVPTVVSSLRAVDWARFEPNFFAVFPRRALEGAPRTWVVLTRADSARARAVLQRDLVTDFPNVSAIDLTRVQQALDAVIGRISTVIRFLAGFSIATGFVVLLGAVSTSRLQRVRESVLLRAIGATRRQIAAILFAEYLLLGVLAALAGIILSLGAGWALAHWLFDVSFEPTPVALIVIGVGLTILATATGVWASREVFRHTPMEAIREE